MSGVLVFEKPKELKPFVEFSTKVLFGKEEQYEKLQCQ